MKAMAIIPHSKKPLWMMLTPNTGNVVIKIGSKAQWMAQRTEVVMPTASQFSFKFIRTAKIGKCNNVAKTNQPYKLLK